MTTNVFDYFENLPTSDKGPAPWAARAPRRPQRAYDLKLTPCAPDWKQDPASVEALEQIRSEPWVEAVIEQHDAVRLRLADSWIEMAGAALGAGGSAEAPLADLAHGQRFSVQFWDPNATKALHIGHLRNLAIGNALASALAQAGGRVERRSSISDVGRSIGEAMAGAQQSGALEPWYKTRACVIAGQRKTLARLGISFDRVCFESDFPVETAELTEAGLHSDTLTRREDGVIVHPIGFEELLIDELTEWLDEEIDGDRARREVRRSHPYPERIAAQVALGYFLPHPATPDIDFDATKLLSEQESLGWDLARARAHRDGGGPGDRHPAESRDYRFAVLQSELYRRYLRLTVQRLDVRPLAHYLKHLSIWYLERDRNESVGRVVNTLLDRSARGLGMEAAR